MFQRISQLSLFCVLAVLALGSTSKAASRYPRHASCSSCSEDSPGALSSPWYGAPEDYSKRDYRGLERESSPFRVRHDFRGPTVFPSTYQHHHESSNREHDNYGIRKSEYTNKHTYPHTVTPAPTPAPRPAVFVSPNHSKYPSRYPFEAFRRSQNPEHRPRDFTRRPQHNPERNYPGLVPNRERSPENGHYYVQRDRIPQETSLGFRRGNREEEGPAEEIRRFRNEGIQASRNEQPSLEPRSKPVQYRPESEDSEEEELIDDGRGRRFRIGTVVRPSGSRPVSRQVQDEPREQTRKDRSREAEILRVTQITIDPEAAYVEDSEPDLSVLRFTPENARGARPYQGGWEEEEFVDVRKETPFGASEMISMDKESFGPGGFEEETFTEEFDSFGWRRQAQDPATSGIVVIQSRQAPKDPVDISVEDSDDDSKIEDAVMKIAPRKPKDKNSGQKDFDDATNPDYYGDIVYPPTNDSESGNVPEMEADPGNTTVAPKKVE